MTASWLHAWLEDQAARSGMDFAPVADESLVSGDVTMTVTKVAAYIQVPKELLDDIDPPWSKRIRWRIAAQRRAAARRLYAMVSGEAFPEPEPDYDYDE